MICARLEFIILSYFKNKTRKNKNCSAYILFHDLDVARLVSGQLGLMYKEQV